MKKLLAFICICFSAFFSASCGLLETPCEGRYVFYSVQKISSPEMIWYEGDSFVERDGKSSVVLTEDFMVLELTKSQGERNRGLFIMQGDYYLYEDGVAGYWKKTDRGVLLTFDVSEEEVEPWFMECDGKTIEFDEEGYLFTLKKQD